MIEPLFPLPQTRVPIVGADRAFPVGRIFCVGRNYAAHAREMGADPNAEPPIFFMKPANAAVFDPKTLAFPSDTDDLHHEAELVLAIGKAGAAIAADEALSHVLGYAVGIDLTKRDRQAEAKAKGQPWERAKAFDASAPISAIQPATAIGHPTRARIRLRHNGVVRQDADIGDMIWGPAAIVATLSTLWRLEPGDLIFTGTPEGVGAIAEGARLDVDIEGVGALSLQIGDQAR